MVMLLFHWRSHLHGPIRDNWSREAVGVTIGYFATMDGNAAVQDPSVFRGCFDSSRFSYGSFRKASIAGINVGSDSFAISRKFLHQLLVTFKRLIKPRGLKFVEESAGSNWVWHSCAKQTVSGLQDRCSSFIHNFSVELVVILR